MNTIIHKLALEPGQLVYDLPESAQLLSCAFQRGVPVAWYAFRAEDVNNLRTRTLLLAATGDELAPELLDELQRVPTRFVGTMQNAAEDYVLHLWERA